MLLVAFIYLHSRAEAEEHLERFAGGDGLQVGLGGQAVAEENRHIAACQEQIVGVVRGLPLFCGGCPRVAESYIHHDNKRSGKQHAMS